MATIYEVSKLAGVSLATVSRVMNNNAKVSDKTRTKVLEAMEQLGYRPNSIAQSLASNRTNSVGVLVSELHGGFFGLVMNGIETELRLADKHIIITTGHSDEAQEKSAIDFLIGRKCDALILLVDSVSDEYLIQVSKTIPTVLINRKVDEISDNCISLDNQYGGYLAAKHLLEQGHRDIAYIAGPDWKVDSYDRFVGHKKALAEYNIDLNDSYYFEGDFNENSGYKCFHKINNSGINFTAIACGNDEMASGAMKAARESGYILPKDLSIIGFDNNMFASYLYPELTTIDNSAYQMGKMATDIILKDVYKHKDLNIAKIVNIFEPKLVKRNSVNSI
ncbi:LacI family DNA-binding transcriptional regulator [Thalassomonas sp. M1454]|uniref:LacI family DNA-binding transcriptional regulator n=1 Tax=Thalassomonas sp. M1454 TaxID=2594477 RepID=UPI0011816449|nr:LacI family DNA-binding transcriptional regulator [Thalassomonas sp. M1454]TRX53841.1 LacI family DNA-binding transcriptional regulator [Thalassomonas sp. M1454]